MDFKFVYKIRDVNLNRMITVKANKKLVTKILNNIFSSTNTSYKVLDTQIFLVEKKSDEVTAIKELPLKIIEVQDIEVSGFVTDEDGNPLPGASILEKGTTSGTESDFDGNFSLNVTNANATLVVSFIGYLPQEIAVAGQEKLTIALIEDAANLEEVVVVGYGTVKKSDLTGSVGQMKAKEINSYPATNVMQSMSGRITGVQVVQSTGAPGAPVSVRIRGTNSIQGDNEPLYVVDGFPVSGNPTNINNSDIESLEVLNRCVAA